LDLIDQPKDGEEQQLDGLHMIWIRNMAGLDAIQQAKTK
jgi:hypothetical protein